MSIDIEALRQKTEECWAKTLEIRKKEREEKRQHKLVDSYTYQSKPVTKQKLNKINVEKSLV